MIVADSDPRCCDHVAHSGHGWTYCARCGTRCRRDSAGAIEIYVRGHLDAPDGSTNRIALAVATGATNGAVSWESV